MKTKLIAVLLIVLLPLFSMAQSLDDTMRSNNRIYVVIAVIVVILLGLILYMVRVEKKLKKLESNHTK